MKVVVAIDSFKGSLSSIEAGTTTAKAIWQVFPDAIVDVFPMADGGEGTVDALTEGLEGEIVHVDVTGPLGERVTARYGLLPLTKTAVIEMADAAGLPMVPLAKRNPLNTTTYGLGELIIAALDAGCRDFIIGIGGSATNDAGLGMLMALGGKFLNADGESVGMNGGDLKNIETIDISGIDPRLKDCRINVACDVNNPLFGEMGCSAVYGPQKGATPEIVVAMDRAIERFSVLAKAQCGVTGALLPGAGAAGGLGYAFHAFLGAELAPGINLILDAINIEEKMHNIDFLITGEGRMDRQTAMGKAPAGVAQLAKRISPNCKTIAVCGCALADAIEVNNHGIDAYFPILHGVVSLQEAMDHDIAELNLSQTVIQVMNLLK